ncbi:transcriptional regulator, TetR family [Alkalidesulfovibrio alkalitolerans DSM 16529]|uniref:Transcriptional regulator, TetR family n=2 Tax=Alkalidesulfovibrio alkalitolerans TaxID=293256 RepID=S7UTN2_9BACT|nr:transcriptional regulator, TetR family [Alkalidesulfovibrio alkalitolerans DSM 16529]
MRTAERKRREQERMRKAILDASLALFAKGGIRAVSMRNIAERIAYSPGTIYRYFEGKGSILQELRVGAFAIFYDRVIDQSHLEDPLEQLQATAKAYINFALERPEYYELMFNTPEVPATQDPDGSMPPMRSYLTFRSNVAACLAAGHFPKTDPDQAAVALWAALHGLSGLLLAGMLRMAPEEERLTLALNAMDFALRRN